MPPDRNTPEEVAMDTESATTTIPKDIFSTDPPVAIYFKSILSPTKLNFVAHTVYRTADRHIELDNVSDNQKHMFSPNSIQTRNNVPRRESPQFKRRSLTLLSRRCIFWNQFLALSRPDKTWTSKVSIDVYLTIHMTHFKSIL